MKVENLLTAAVWLWLKDAGEKQAQLDRVLREKHSVEAELEKVYYEGIVESGRESRDVTELSQRACTAERQRDEVQMKADSLACQLRRAEAMYVLPVVLHSCVLSSLLQGGMKSFLNITMIRISFNNLALP